MNPEEIAHALLLRSRKATYPDIAKILGYSTDKVFYHCNPTQKAKRKNRNQENPNRKISDKLRQFTSRKNTISLPTFFNKFEENPTCWLTGRPLDLLDYSNCHLDHIIPKSRGGKTTIDNMQLACKEANQAKSALLLGEFLQLCRDVVKTNKTPFSKAPKKQLPVPTLPYKIRYQIRYRISGFSYRGSPCKTIMSVDKFLEKFGAVTSCYLCCRPINVYDPLTYVFDHIVPTARGGENTENNLGLTCPIANQSKQDLTVEEYVALCQEVLGHFKMTPILY